MATASAGTTPSAATLFADAVQLSPLGAVADAGTLAKDVIAYLAKLVTPGWQTITTAYLHASAAYSDGKHHGVDLAAPLGSPIRAPLGGIIVGPLPGYNGPAALGNGIYERLDDGTILVFGHTVAGPSVPVGTRVQAGQQIGTVGSSGNSTGPHVHFQVLPPGILDPLKDVDPLAWLKAHLAGVPVPTIPLPPLPGLPGPQPAPQPGPGHNPAPQPQPTQPGQAPAAPAWPTADLGHVGPFPVEVDLSWLLRLALTVVALLLIVYGVFKLADVEGTVTTVAAEVVKKAVPGV
jgi:murein DD-endopeptidase MepM/ murein hydrolase activator NlpD